MDKKLNICLVSREFPPDTAFGGIATYSLDTARILRTQGHNVTVVSQSLKSSYITDIQGVQVHKVKIPYPFSSYACLPIFILAYNILIFRHILKLHRQSSFDLIDVPDHLAEGLFTLLIPDMPVITRLHTPYSLLVNMGLNNYRKGVSYELIKFFEGIALRRSNAIYAPSMDLVRYCNNLFNIEDIALEVFGYPLDLSLFSPAPKAVSLPPKRILFLGRLEQRKGIETMAAAFPEIYSQYPDVSLTLVGNDTPNIFGFSSGREYLQNIFRSARCLDAVSFLDSVPLSELPSLIHSYDIIWIPSLYDNFPLTCLEAMACGKPVVVSNAGGLPEMVKHGETGLVFRTGDAADLAQKTKILLSSPELVLTLGHNARLYCEKNYTDEVIYKKNMQLYQKAINNLRAGRS
jgi:glycosyltransferase involved in cell wall biosynthesis